ncbi:MAG: prolipoprotein diacylglyceryl transferase [Deltaproteobacteria bacterium]|nr:prolipoprotein diacylglyceryl transferase [Deltaproteobacteria bacterium]
MGYLTWSIDPNFITIGSIQIRWYGIMFAAAFILGYQIMKWIYLHEGKNIRNIDQLLLYLIGGTIIGARLGHCLLYDPSYYLSNPIKILAVWEGGLASHGGGVGVLIGLYLYKRKTQESYLWLLDRIAIPTALTAFFIRIGNLFNSEILGVPATVPWAVIFERIDSIPRHPAQVYEASSYVLIFFLLVFIYKRGERKLNNGAISGMFLVSVFTSRFFIEFVKTKQDAYSLGFWMSTGQVLSIPFVVAGLLLILMALKQFKPMSR